MILGKSKNPKLAGTTLMRFMTQLCTYTFECLSVYADGVLLSIFLPIDEVSSS